MIRLLYVLISAAVGAACAYLGQPLAHRNTDLWTLLITVFTVFAGFLVAIIAVVGDPALLPAGSWRKVELVRDRIESRLFWQICLFSMYLITIALIFIAVLLKDACLEPPLSAILTWIERTYLFLSVFSFIMSFSLPMTLLSIQKTRVEAELVRRRSEVNLRD